MYAGSGQDVVAGEAGLIWTYVPRSSPSRFPSPRPCSSGPDWPAGSCGGATMRGVQALDDFLLAAVSMNASLRKMADDPSYRCPVRSAAYDEQYGRFPSILSHPPSPPELAD